MSVSYDRRLRYGTVSKVLEPCCREMDMCLLNGVIYMSAQKGKVHGLMMKIQDKPKKGYMFFMCPFCGARLQEVDE
ncbi:hypothetical protein PED39_05270 [Methanomassiliicoccales archaeon LGM-RCC1]|nr:hypothetical protein PED39_05270 [Methanomassiliicoccales archaeon LGM-RCC1]